ncbi:MAG: DUF4199 domain-containing protein [Gemmatimonadales bacterium]|nr:DUF4199 domain-containing protein [Gemmatimonadota bacterium]MCC7131196.1 DUF4199 domain-containing protein [Gemmatimonadales bacterium]MDX2058149.1 DUF4199 domain-containing protein [Gemmatimonadales bacterium]
MRKVVLTFGLIAGAIMSAVMLLGIPFKEQIGFDRAAIVGYTSMVLAFLMVFFGVKSYRDNVAGGELSFGRALQVGLLITLVATVCYVATWQLAYHQFMPDFASDYAAYSLEKARASGATEAELARQTQQMTEYIEMYRNPLFNIAITFLEPLPVGLVFTLVTAGVLGRKRRSAEAIA